MAPSLEQLAQIWRQAVETGDGCKFRALSLGWAGPARKLDHFLSFNEKPITVPGGAPEGRVVAPAKRQNRAELLAAEYRRPRPQGIPNASFCEELLHESSTKFRKYTGIWLKRRSSHEDPVREHNHRNKSCLPGARNLSLQACAQGASRKDSSKAKDKLGMRWPFHDLMAYVCLRREQSRASSWFRYAVALDHTS